MCGLLVLLFGTLFVRQKTGYGCFSDLEMLLSLNFKGFLRGLERRDRIKVRPQLSAKSVKSKSQASLFFKDVKYYLTYFADVST